MFPIVVMDAETRRIFGAGKIHSVKFFADRRDKSHKNHPEITVADFAKARDIIDNGEIMTNSRSDNPGEPDAEEARRRS